MNTQNKTKKHFLLDHPILTGIVMYVIQQALFIGIYSQTILLIQDPMISSALACLINAGSALVIALLMKMRLKNGYTLGFTGKNFLKSLMLGWPFVAMIIAQALLGSYNFDVIAQSTVSSVLTALFMALSAGGMEEILFRSAVANNMMRVWFDKKNGIYAAMFVSAAIFGVVHLTNGLVAGLTLNLLFQVGYAFGLGVLFAGIYFRTKNLWGCILLHSLFDFPSFLSTAGTTTAESVKQIVGGTVDIPTMIFNLAVTVIGIGVGLYLARPAKHEEIKANFAPADAEKEETVSKKMAAQAA